MSQESTIWHMENALLPREQQLCETCHGNGQIWLGDQYPQVDKCFVCEGSGKKVYLRHDYEEWYDDDED